MSRFKNHLINDNKETNNTIRNLQNSIENMEELLKTVKGDKKQQKKIMDIIKKQKELIGEIEANYN